MKKMSTMMATMGVAMMMGGTVLPAVNASATVTPELPGVGTTLKQGPGYKRDAFLSNNIAHRAYKIANKKANVYKITGTKKNAKLKSIHNFKNYKGKTWTRTKITQVEHGGHWMMYYYVKSNAKNKAAGWVKLTDVKLKHPNKASKHVKPEFDVWYRTLTQKQRNWYHEWSYNAATDSEGNPAEL